EGGGGALEGGAPAAHADRLSGHPAGEIRGEKGDERRDILRLAEPTDRIEREDPLAVLRDELLVAVRGLDPAERQRVHGDVLAAELLRERAREGEHRAARTGRPAQTLLADARRVADDADDAAAVLGRQLRRRRVADVEHPVEVDVDLALPLLGLGLEKELRLDEARVVDDDIEPAEICDDA